MSAQRYTQRARCPGCGLWVLRNDATRDVAHEFPECGWFQSVIAESKGERRDGLEVIDVETGREPQGGRPGSSS